VLGQIAFLVAIVALLATSAVAGVAGALRAQHASAAAALLDPALAAALAAYENGVVVPAIGGAAGGDGTSAPAAIPALSGGVAWSAQRYVLQTGAAPAYAAIVTVTPTATSVPACIPAAGASVGGADVEREGQCSPFVQESRLSLALAADAGPLAGSAVAALAHRREIVTLRLFAQPPYAMIAGVTDDAAPGDPHEGDVDGYAGATGAFGPPPSPDDTTIHVVFACTPAAGDCSAGRPAPPDAPTDLPWSDGNANAPP
jgi:hypothetical protein